MKKQKGRVLVPIPYNNLYSQILFSIGAGNNYPKKIAESLGREIANTHKQLNVLEKKSYVKSKLEGDKNVFPFERRIYEIEWEKIVEEFDKYYFKGVRIGFPPIKLLSESNFDFHHQGIKKNSYLQNMFKYIFSYVGKDKKVYEEGENEKVSNLKELFESLPIIFGTAILLAKETKDKELKKLNDKELKKLNLYIEKDEQFKNFIGFMSVLYDTYYKQQLSFSIKYSLERIFNELEDKKEGFSEK